MLPKKKKRCNTKCFVTEIMSMSILSSHLYSGPLAYATAEFTLKKKHFNITNGNQRK